MALLTGRGGHVETGGTHAGRRYSIDPTDYIELCPACHKRYDGIVANLGVVPGVKSCSIEGCTGVHVALGLCSKHYDLRRRHGPESLSAPR